MKLAILLLAAACAVWGCRSKPHLDLCNDSRFGDGKRGLPWPSARPCDWPYALEEFSFLVHNARCGALDPEALQRVGLHSRKEITAFAHRVLKMDLSPCMSGVSSSVAGLASLGAYTLLGYYGSLEDAQAHFEAVKALDAGTLKKMSESERARLEPMVETLGYYLMRDHLMPQPKRELVAEIEDYLYRCSSIEGPSCWPHEEFDEAIHDLWSGAFSAMSLSLSRRAKKRAQKYADFPKESEPAFWGRIALKQIEIAEGLQERERKQLPPLLPEAEIDR